MKGCLLDIYEMDMKQFKD